MKLMKKKEALNLWYYLAAPIIICLVAIITYLPSLYYSFQFDDIANIQKHFNIRHHSFFKLFFKNSRWISYWLNSVYYSLGRFDPFFYRCGNIIIHLTNGILVFCITQCIFTKTKEQSFFSSSAYNISLLSLGFFLLHPVQTQTVSYVIQGQLEGLSTLFILAMVFVYIWRDRTNSAKVRHCSTALFFILAFFSCGTKEIAIISPALIILVDWFFVAQGSIRSLIKRWWLYGIQTLIVVCCYIYLLRPTFFYSLFKLNMIARNNIGNVITRDPRTIITTWSYFISQFKVILHYIWIFFYPINISVEYDWVLVDGFFSFDCIVPFFILLIIAFSLMAFWFYNPTNIICFALLWFFICILPRSSLIPSPELLVDYKTYMASFGILLCIAIAVGFIGDYIAKKTDKKYLPYLGALLMLALAYGTYSRNKVWRSGQEFWWNIILNAPNKARAYNNFGVELSSKKKFEESISYFKKAIEMDKFYPDPYNNIAVQYTNLGKIDNAISALKSGLRIRKNYAEGYNNLGALLFQKKQHEQAEICFKNALKIRPTYGKAYYNYGRLLLDQNKKEEAWQAFYSACMEGDFDAEAGFYAFGVVSFALKKYNDAIFAYKKVLEHNSRHYESLFNLANSYFFEADYNNAKEYFNQALDVNKDDFRAWYNLGETYAKLGSYYDAIRTFEKIKSAKDQAPQVNLRLAYCYEKTNDIDKSRALLEEVMNLANTTPEFVKVKEKASMQFAGLNKRAETLPNIAML